jgi:hypothetical protein
MTHDELQAESRRLCGRCSAGRPVSVDDLAGHIARLAEALEPALAALSAYADETN